MNTSEFAKSVRDKYPGAYDNISDQDLTSKLVTKYPQYQSQISDLGNSTPSLPSSGPVEKGLLGQTINPPTNTQSPQYNQNLERSPQYPTQAMTDPSLSDALTVQGVGELGLGIGKGGLAAGKILAESGPSGLAKAVGSKVANFKGFVQNLLTKPATDEELGIITNKIQNILVNARQQVGKKLGELRGTNVDAIDRLGQIADKGPGAELGPQEVAKKYQDYFSKLPSQKAPVMEELGLENPPTLGEMKGKLGVQSTEGAAPYTPHPDYNELKPGDRFTIKSNVPGMPDLEVVHKGPMTLPPSKAFAEKMGYTPEQLKQMSQPTFDLKTEIPAHAGDVSHPVDSTIAKETFERHGYQVPEGTPNSKQELQDLIKMRSNMYDQISKKSLDQSGNIVKAVGPEDERAFRAGIKQINDRIEQIPGGQAIRSQEKKFSQLASIYDDLQSKLKEPEAAKSFLQRIFNNPTGANKDYINKLMKLEELTGTNVVSNLKDAFESTKGLTYEQLKHPIASIIKGSMPTIGNAARTVINVGKALVPPPSLIAGQALQYKPFNVPQMQSLKDQLNNNQTVQFKESKYANK